MEPAAIVEQLPKLWATDLKEFIVHRSSFIVDRRAVLFIDSYEKLLQTVDGVRDTVDASQKTDAWVRELVKQLPEVLWVMSGRQKLRWEEVEKEWGDVLSQHELGALPEHSARQFLSSCGITDEPIQDAIAKGSQGLPHYLNLAVDTYLEIEQSGQRAGSVQSLFSGAESSDSPEQLFAQFIRHLDQPEIATLQVLSASRFWNYGLFEHLVTEYQTGYPLTAYDDLSRFSFVGEGAAPETRTMHDLMREALQEHQAPELRRRVHLFLHELYAKQLEGLDVKGITEKHKAALTEAFYHGRQVKSAAEFWTWFRAALRVFDDAGQCRLLVPLLRETVESLVATGLGLAKPNLAEPLFELARQLDENGDYDEAEPLYRRALAMVEGAHEPENTLVLNCLSMLAQLLRKRARFEEAEVMCRRVVELRNKLGGPAIDHAEAFDNLALVLAEEEKYGEAEELFRRALAISEKEVGPEHRKTGTKLCNLATMLWSQRRFGEAESLFRSALAIDEKVLGVNHPSLVFTLDGLANTLHNLGRYQEAEALLRRSLKLCEENLGPEHPDTAVCLNNLGSLLRAQSRFAEAEPLLRRALKVHQKKMGHDHPLTMRMASNLFVALVRSGNHVEAESMILSAIATREEKLGPDHPLTIFAVHWGGVLYKNQGRYDEAETYLRRAVEANTRIRGPEHLDTLGSWAALGGLEERRGRYAEAESVYRDVLPKREKVLGPENPAVAEVAFQLAGICSRDGRYAEAEAFYRRALAIREKVFGPDHALVAETLEGLAKVCEQTGRTAEAQELAARAKRIRAQAPTEKAVDSRQ
jgi:tetratricopeptide (TPR) repeat protein